MMESGDKFVNDAGADPIELKTELNELVGAIAQSQPLPPETDEVSLGTPGGALQEKSEHNEIVDPPIILDSISYPADTESFIREKLQNVVDLPEAVKKNKDLVADNEERDTVSKTQRLNYDKTEIQKVSKGEASKAYFLNQISLYKKMLIGETGFVNPQNNQEVDLRLLEITRFFTDSSSPSALWVVTPNMVLEVGGIQTNVQFPLFLEYYVLGRNAQLARGPPPPFYEKLVDQIKSYASTLLIGPSCNPFAQTMRINNFGSDDETMHTYDDVDLEMIDEKPGVNPLPDYRDLNIDHYIDFIRAFTEEFMPNTECITSILIYLQLGTYDISTWDEFVATLTQASLNTQNQILNIVRLSGVPIRVYGVPGQEDMPEHVSTPPVSLDSLDLGEVAEREWNPDARAWRSLSLKSSKSSSTDTLPHTSPPESYQTDIENYLTQAARFPEDRENVHLDIQSQASSHIRPASLHIG